MLCNNIFITFMFSLIKTSFASGNASAAGNAASTGAYM